jgi:hypothetical protein
MIEKRGSTSKTLLPEPHVTEVAAPPPKPLNATPPPPVAQQSALAHAAPYLIWCAPTAFVSGVTALIASWLLFYIYHPEGFVGTLPSISETISTSPADFVFQGLMCVVAPCIFLIWPLNFFATRGRHAAQIGRGRYVPLERGLNILTCFTGMMAGVFLGALSIIKLHDGDVAHDLHIEFSAAFYISQILTFIFDAASAAIQRYVLRGSDSRAQRLSLRWRMIIGGSAIADALLFFYLYLHRDVFSDAYFAQALYVFAEYALATLCFAYPLAVFPELREYYARPSGN